MLQYDDNMVFSMDLFISTNAPKTKVLRFIVSCWQFVLYFVIAGVVICACSNYEYNLHNLISTLPQLQGKAHVLGVISIASCLMNWITPLIVAWMLIVIGKYNALFDGEYRIPSKILIIMIALQLTLGILMILDEALNIESVYFTAFGGVILLANWICMIVLSVCMQRQWRRTNADLEDMGKTWFVYSICNFGLAIITIILGILDNWIVYYLPALLFTSMDIYLFIKMTKHLKEIPIVYQVERNLYILDHPNIFSEEQHLYAQLWKEDFKAQCD